MTATYTEDYTLNDESTGWPPIQIIQPYPDQNDYNYRQSPYANNVTTDQILPYTVVLNTNQRQDTQTDDYQKPDSEYVRPLAIRRRQPDATDTPAQQLTVPVALLTPQILPTNERIPSSKHVSHSAPTQNHSRAAPSPFDPTDRPIQPMRDTSVYHNPLSANKNNQQKRIILPPIKPRQTSSRCESDIFPLPPQPIRNSPYNRVDRLQSPPKPIRASPYNKVDRIQSPPKPVRASPYNPPNRQQSILLPVQSSPVYKPSDTYPVPRTRNQINNVTARRPVRTDIIQSLFDDEHSQQRYQRHPVQVQGYNDNYNKYPVAYHIKSATKRPISYQEGSFVKTQNMPNYPKPQGRRAVYVQEAPVKTISYRT
ncbi:unnamed protein product [Adineta steineri]|uniref:Uncharacterized protein n=1 Tax=Adineta steineri TaxID=433720 RepID=A0A814N7C2_9BILA|nr:unnamed protein product [Adineta steineri]CAF1088116.1 unnamed protein product [Adineta steineri]